MTSLDTLEKTEIDLLLEGVRRRYGYDFTHYSYLSLKRRLEYVRKQGQFAHYTLLLDRLLHDEKFFDHFLKSMSITVTEIFRDPDFYKAVREKIVPALKTFSFVKIWLAGCATGEEAYSMAILLLEENFLSRARIYATDLNKHSLDHGQKGVYAAQSMLAGEENYIAAGGKSNFTDYYSVGYDLAKFKDYLKERITFSYHNLVTDGVFGEMHLILCRNVLIYFDRSLQERVFFLFSESLRHGGYLCLGSKETLNFSSVKPSFIQVEDRQKIYKKHIEHIRKDAYDVSA